MFVGSLEMKATNQLFFCDEGNERRKKRRGTDFSQKPKKKLHCDDTTQYKHDDDYEKRRERAEKKKICLTFNFFNFFLYVSTRKKDVLLSRVEIQTRRS